MEPLLVRGCQAVVAVGHLGGGKQNGEAMCAGLGSGTRQRGGGLAGAPVRAQQVARRAALRARHRVL